MAVIDLNVEEISRAGVDATDNGSLSTGDTYQFANDGRTELHFRKTGAGACTVTVITPNTVDGKAIADHTFVVPATTGDVRAGTWPREIYNNSAGKVQFTVSEVTGLTVALVRVP